MKRFILTLLGLILVLFVVAAIAAQVYLAPFVKEQIEVKGSEALGAPIKVQSLSIGLFPPISASASGISFQIPDKGVRAKVSRLIIHATPKFTLDYRNALKSLQITLIKPEIIYDLSANSASSPQQSGSAADETTASNSLSQIPEIETDIGIDQAKVTILESGVEKYLIDPLNLALKFKSLATPFTLALEGQLLAKAYTAKPVVVKVNSVFLYDLSQFTTDKTFLEVAGVRARLSGGVNTKSKNGEIKIVADNQTLDTDAQFAGAELKGPLKGSLNSTITLVNAAPKVKLFVIDADFTATSIKYKNIFAKPAAIPLKINASGGMTEETLDIARAQINFEKLETYLAGRLALPTAPTRNSKLTFDVKRTSLSGWERFFPSMSKAPVSGFIEATGEVTGNFEKPETVNGSIGPIKLEQIRGSLDWISEDKLKSAKGSFSLDGKANLTFTGTNVQNANADLKVDLSNLDLSMKDSFEKSAQTAMRLEVHATQSPQGIELKNTSVILGENEATVSGTLKDPAKPKIDFKFNAPKLSIGELSSILLSLKKYNLTGQASGSGTIAGTCDFKQGYEKSVLRLTADVTADLPTLTCPEPPAATSESDKTESSASAPAPEPMLPAWPIARTAVIKSKVKIAKLKCKKVDADGVLWAGQLSGGALSGNLTIQNVFGGKVNVTSLRTNLSQAQPDSEGTVKTENLDVNQAITWFSPKWKDMVKGQLFGTNTFFAPDSTRPDFLNKTKLQGSVELKNAFISTLQLDEMINQKLAKIPGLGQKENVNSKGVAAQVKAEYSFANAVMTLKKFNFLSPEKNEITATGTVDILQNAKLSGTAYLATAPVGGSVKAANSDSQGRLVLPFELNGNLSDPSISFAEKTIQKLVENTAKTELQTQGKKELEKKLEELKKKGLKGLFGK